MAQTLPSVFQFNDFRSYLAAYQQARQSIEPTFTKSEFSRLLRLPNTRSYFTDVLKGKVVSPTFVERFVEVLALDKVEAQYFRVLIKFNQATNTDERELYFEQLISLNRTPKRVLDRRVFAYYKDWHNAVIRALLNTGDFGDDYEAIARKIVPPITPKRVKESIELMLDLGLIVKNQAGHYKPTDTSITTPEFIRDELVKQFQLRCFEVARSAVASQPSPGPIAATNMISISERGYKRLTKLTQKYRAQVRSLVAKDEDPADRVCQIVLGIVPLTRPASTLKNQENPPCA